MWKQWQIFFRGVQKSLQTMTVAMKLRCLLLRGKTRTHLDSILKSKVITLLTKVRIVKAMVSMLFPVVMYRYESWIIKNAECQRNWYFQIVLLEKILKSPLDYKDINPEYLLEGLKDWCWSSNALATWCKELTHGKDLDKGRRRRGQQRMRCLDRMMHSVDMSLSKLWETVKYMGAWHAAVLGVTKSQSQLSDWKTTKNGTLGPEQSSKA